MKFKTLVVAFILLMIFTGIQCLNSQEQQRNPGIEKNMLIELTQGIEGGIVPPHVSLKVLIARGSSRGSYHVWTMQQPNMNDEKKYFKGTLSQKIS